MEYRVKRTAEPPELQGLWEGPVWSRAETLRIDRFLPQSSDHRPQAEARLLYDDACLYGVFRVRDRYVRCVHTEFQSSVCRDSCVEFFFQPDGATHYFNLEFNCGGTFLMYWAKDPDLAGGRLKEYTKVSEERARLLRVYHSLPEKIEPEIQGPVEWFLEFAMPFEMLEPYAGEIGDPAGRAWRANFYKCGDDTSHPHWASWAPLDEKNFHLPRCFGDVTFEG